MESEREEGYVVAMKEETCKGEKKVWKERLFK